MRILYGINGTGNGHLTKSLRVIGAMEARGHRVDALVSGMNGNVPAGGRIDHARKGFTFAYRSGSIDLARTLARSDLPRFVRDVAGMDLSAYDRVVTDFEPVTAWACRLSGRECTGISHQAAFLCEATPRPRRRSLMQEAFMRLFAPVTRHAGIHFRRYCESVYPPILRPMPAEPTNLGHATVYLPGTDHGALVEHFARLGVETHLFSAGPAGRGGCVWSRPLDMGTFHESLSTCDLVVTAGGFETPAEALAMGKRLIVVPIGGHYEQACNAEALSRMGVRVCPGLSSLRDLSCDAVDYDWEDPLEGMLSDLGF